MPLVDHAVNHLVKAHPYLRYLADDFKAGGYLHLMTLLPKMRSGLSSITEFKPEAYIKLCVQNQCVNLFYADVQIGNRKADREGIPVTVPLPDNLEVAATEANDLRRTIYEVCHSERELQIVCMKEHGYTQREIAETVGIDQALISRTIKSIFNRLQEQLNA